MVTNTCKKHGSAFPEDDCPQCVRERWEQSILDSDDFFKRLEDHRVQLKYLDIRESIPVEELYQHFRVRLMKELGLGPR